jgi:hypothetical protein
MRCVECWAPRSKCLRRRGRGECKGPPGGNRGRSARSKIVLEISEVKR